VIQLVDFSFVGPALLLPFLLCKLLPYLIWMLNNVICSPPSWRD